MSNNVKNGSIVKYCVAEIARINRYAPELPPSIDLNHDGAHVELTMAAQHQLEALIDEINASKVAAVRRPFLALLLFSARALVARCSGTASRTPNSAPPKLGQFLLCIFIRPDRQQERLADFEELFNTEWLPRFGPLPAKLIYIFQAVRAGIAIVGIGVVASIADRVWRALIR